MKLVTKISSLLVVALFSVNAVAADMALEAGFRSQSGDAPTGSTSKSQTAFQLGGSGVFDFGAPVALRTGFFYTQRNLNFTNDTTGVETKTKLNYFDIPALAFFKFDYGGVYAGVVASINLDNSTEGGTKMTGVKSFLLPIQFGAAFKVAPQLGVNAFFETIPGDVANNQSGYKAVGVNLMVFWD